MSERVKVSNAVRMDGVLTRIIYERPAPDEEWEAIGTLSGQKATVPRTGHWFQAWVISKEAAEKLDVRQVHADENSALDDLEGVCWGDGLPSVDTE